MAQLFLDRIEGDVAVLLDGKREVKLPRAYLPAGAREGDVLQLSLVRDLEATKKAQQETKTLRDKLGSDDDGGDLKL
ncbi:MAG: DUF3006 domain-containing protein [Deltaproteobacteria bacterium]|nr:DUF3006 domain-containing protein [Deltaproteobacteria bacterium]